VRTVWLAVWVIRESVSPGGRGGEVLTPRVFRRALVAVLAVLGAEVAFVASGTFGWLAATAVDNATEFVASVLALIAWVWSAARHRGASGRWRWWLVAAMVSFTVGVASWALGQVDRDVPVPTGTLGPAGFTVTPVLALLGLVVRTCGRGGDDRSPLTIGRSRLVQALDLVIIAISAGLFVLAALGEPLARRSGLIVSNSTAYLLLVAGIVVLARLRPDSRDRPVLMVALAALAYTGSSVLFAHYYVARHAPLPPALGAGYLACPAFFALAALAPATAAERWFGYPRLTVREIVRLAVPYLPLIGTVMFLAGGLLAGVTLNRQQQVTLMVLMSVVILRQLLTLVENNLLLRKAEHEALHDPLTGVANRTLFLHALAESLAWAAASGRPLMLLLCDLDDFKEVNDTLGHAAGDAVLREVAGRLRRCARPGDLVARLGGDEFALILRGVPEPPDDLGRRVLADIREPHLLAGRPVVISASVGITRLTAGESGAGIDELVRSADTAMYAAKRRGKNTLAHARDSQPEPA
jgi:diguanylate cyclase